MNIELIEKQFVVELLTNIKEKIDTSLNDSMYNISDWVRSTERQLCYIKGIIEQALKGLE